MQTEQVQGRKGLWDGLPVQVIRWVLLIPLASFYYLLAEMAAVMVLGLIAASDPPVWAIVLILLLGGGPLLYFVWGGAVLGAAGVQMFAPSPRVGCVLWGLFYVPLQVYNAFAAEPPLPWWALAIKALITLGAVVGLKAVFAAEKEAH